MTISFVGVIIIARNRNGYQSMSFLHYSYVIKRTIVHLQYNNDVIISLYTERVQGYTSPALFKAAIVKMK